MTEEVVTIRFTRLRNPHGWRAESMEFPSLTGLGDCMASALRSLTENIPNVLASQQTRIEVLSGQLEEFRKRR